MTGDLISKKTRNEFREFLVGWTLRKLRAEFEMRSGYVVVFRRRTFPSSRHIQPSERRVYQKITEMLSLLTGATP